jgi:hypothetical protein
MLCRDAIRDPYAGLKAVTQAQKGVYRDTVVFTQLLDARESVVQVFRDDASNETNRKRAIWDYCQRQERMGAATGATDQAQYYNPFAYHHINTQKDEATLI